MIKEVIVQVHISMIKPYSRNFCNCLWATNYSSTMVKKQLFFLKTDWINLCWK